MITSNQWNWEKGWSHVSCTEVIPHAPSDGLLLGLCERCVNDAGFHAGMAGASRCRLIERAIGHEFAGPGQPAEWRLGADGAVTCSAFAPDVGEEW